MPIPFSSYCEIRSKRCCSSHQCAGGGDSELVLPVQREPVAAGSKELRVTVGGLKGGHSGKQPFPEPGHLPCGHRRAFSLQSPWHVILVRAPFAGSAVLTATPGRCQWESSHLQGALCASQA